MHRLILFVVFGCVLRAPGVGAGKVELPPVTVESTVEGSYEILRSGEHVGVEDFVRTILSNNKVILESVYEVVEGESVFVSGNNRLEYEEDSGFPWRYYTYRLNRKPDEEHVREVTVEMFTNVAVLTERDDGRERSRTLKLPTGCLFIEGNIAHQLSVALDRYNSAEGGKQSFRVFDPLGGAMTDVVLRQISDSTAVNHAQTAEGRPSEDRFAHYVFQMGRYPASDLYVNSGGVITRIDTGTREISYVLTSMREKDDTTAWPR